VKYVSLFISVENVPLLFDKFQKRHLFSTMDSLAFIMVKHYQPCIFKSVIKVLGSADFMGSPVTLFNSFGTGVGDLVNETGEGMKGENAISGTATGVASGGASLAKNSVFGVTNTTNKVFFQFLLISTALFNLYIINMKLLTYYLDCKVSR
jgi:vacuolar protein sorting-associated protein 13A/C